MKKSIVFAFLLFVSLNLFAQKSELKFDKRVYQCEDKWVVYPPLEKDSTYRLGYIYIDRQAGFTYHFEKKFKISKEGKFIPDAKDKKTRIISRIENFNEICASIPKEKFSELGIPEVPDFMKLYVSEKEEDDLVQRGFFYNHIGASDLAIPILEKAQSINPDAKNALFELTYSYNATKQYEKSIKLLHLGIEKDKENGLLYKELIYALVSDNRLNNAEIAYENASKILKNKADLIESSYNIAQVYFSNKDKKNFERWAKITTDNSNNDKSIYIKNIELMKKELN